VESRGSRVVSNSKPKKQAGKTNKEEEDKERKDGSYFGEEKTFYNPEECYEDSMMDSPSKC